MKFIKEFVDQIGPSLLFAPNLLKQLLCQRDAVCFSILLKAKEGKRLFLTHSFTEKWFSEKTIYIDSTDSDLKYVYFHRIVKQRQAVS